MCLFNMYAPLLKARYVQFTRLFLQLILDFILPFEFQIWIALVFL